MLEARFLSPRTARLNPLLATGHVHWQCPQRRSDDISDDAVVHQDAEVVALARADASKSVLWKGTLVVFALTRYRLQSFGNLCDMNGGGTNSSAPFLREKQQTPIPFSLEQTHRKH